jgi:hypothetical protein
MPSLRRRAHLAWLGILLVLMPLIAPAISHAVQRAHAVPTVDIGWNVGWCSPQAQASAFDATATAATTDEAPATAFHLPAACDYCGWPATMGAIPVIAQMDPPPELVALPATSPRDTPAPASPWRDAHGARAPPVLNDTIDPIG